MNKRKFCTTCWKYTDNYKTFDVIIELAAKNRYWRDLFKNIPIRLCDNCCNPRFYDISIKLQSTIL